MQDRAACSGDRCPGCGTVFQRRKLSAAGKAERMNEQLCSHKRALAGSDSHHLCGKGTLPSRGGCAAWLLKGFYERTVSAAGVSCMVGTAGHLSSLWSKAEGKLWGML